MQSASVIAVSTHSPPAPSTTMSDHITLSVSPKADVSSSMDTSTGTTKETGYTGSVENSETANISPVDNVREANATKPDSQTLKKLKSDDVAPSTDIEPANTAVKPPAAAQPTVIKPSLRGKYEVFPDGSGTWQGSWGMDDNAFKDGGIVSPFLYTSTTSGGEATNSKSIKNALFSGYFMLGSTLPGKPSTKHEEKDISFEFFDAPELGEGVLKVVGQGKNQFGTFNLDGTFDTATAQLNCYRVYELRPARARRAAPTSRARSSRKAATTSTVVKKDVTGGKRPRPTSSRKPAPVEAPIINRATRIRRTPSHLLDDMFYGNGEENPLYKIKTLLSSLISNDKEGWFITPVDAVALGLKDYHTIVKKPMDLGTVRKNLESNYYKTEDQVVEDIRLVFSNACLFNPVGHPVNRVAGQHLKIFESELKKLQRSRKSEKKNGRSRKKAVDGSESRRRTAQTPAKSSRHNPFGSSSEDEDSDSSMVVTKRKKTSKRKSAPAEGSEMKVLRKQVEMMNKQIAMMQQMQEQNLYMNSLALNGQPAAQTISAPPAVSQPKKKEARPLSYQEKRQLGQDIHKLPGEMIQGVISIIQESGAPLGGDGDEVELDIEALDTPALKKLQKYVRKCLTKVRSRKSRDTDMMD